MIRLQARNSEAIGKRIDRKANLWKSQTIGNPIDTLERSYGEGYLTRRWLRHLKASFESKPALRAVFVSRNGRGLLLRRRGDDDL